MRIARRMAVFSLGAILALPLFTGVAEALPSGRDITRSAWAQAKIAEAAERFASEGVPVDPSELSALDLGDGLVVIVPRGLAITDMRQGGGGLEVSVAAGEGDGSGPLLATLDGGVTTAAAAYWSMTSQDCFAALFRGQAHMDTCYKAWKQVNDGSSTYDYRKLDMYATMFTEVSTIQNDWGWIAADQDAGPAMSFVDWFPTADDYTSTCISEGISLSGPYAGAGFSSQFCESWDISKSAGAPLGYFKNQWSWGTRSPLKGKDRSVAFAIGTRHSQGGTGIVWGLSWNFAAH